MNKIHIFLENVLGTKFSINDFVECEENGYFTSKTYRGKITDINFSKNEIEISCKLPCKYNKMINIFDIISINHAEEVQT